MKSKSAFLAAVLSLATVWIGTAVSQEDVHPAWTNFGGEGEVMSLAEEGDSIWAATYGGLVRLNTADDSTTYYNSANSPLPGNIVRVVRVDSEGTKWLGTDNGLVRFDGNEWSVLDGNSAGLPPFIVTAIAIDTTETKWLGTQDNGLISYDGESWTHHNSSNSGLPAGAISAVHVGPNGDVWTVVAGETLVRYDGSSFEVYSDTASRPVPGGRITGIDSDSQGRIWLGTAGINGGQGLVGFTRERWNVLNPVDHAILPASVRALSAGGPGWGWVLTEENTVGMYDGEEWVIHDSSNSDLPSGEITALQGFPSGNVWVAVAGGVARYDGERWEHYELSRTGDFAMRGISSISFDQSGHTWISTERSGVGEYDGSAWRSFTQSNSRLPENNVREVLSDSSGSVWMATNSSGLVRYNGSDMVVYSADNSGLPSDSVSDLALAGDGALWLATDRGLVRFIDARWQMYTTSASGLPSNRIAGAWPETGRRVWTTTVGSNSEFDGLIRYDGIQWTVYDTENSGLPANEVVSVAFDRQGTAWIVTGEGDLVTFDGDSWAVNSDIHEGYPEANVADVAISSDGTVWLGTDRGLMQFTGEEWTVYTPQNSGLPGGTTENDRIADVAIDPAGNVWIGTLMSGVARFEP